MCTSSVHTLPGRDIAVLGKKRSDEMLFTIAIVLLVLWALGLVSSYTLGGFVHLLLVVALVLAVVQLASGRRV
jgi:hypothetical protein